MGYFKAPDSNASTRVSQTLLGLVANWVEALHGHMELDDVARSVMSLCGADAALLVRAERRTERMRWFAFVSRDSGMLSAAKGTVLLERVMGQNRFTARPGSLWKLSDSALHSGNGAARPDTQGFAEVFVLMLGHTATDADYFEFQFRGKPQGQTEETLLRLGPTLASAWERRPAGTVQRRLSDLGPRQLAGPDDAKAFVPVMDVTNPMHLSRCEFRICAMVKEGMTSKLIARSLSVHEATVRSHLSSIYSKTATSGIVELIHRLNASEAPRAPRPGPAHIRSA